MSRKRYRYTGKERDEEMRYVKNGYYIDMTADSSIISYGVQ